MRRLCRRGVAQLSPTEVPTRVSHGSYGVKLAYGDGSFKNVFSSDNNFWYVDKTDFIPKLEALNAKAVVSLRNRRMGKTLWQDTLACYYDVAEKDNFAKYFGHLKIGKAPTALANTFHVLPLAFSGLTTDSVEDFKAHLNITLNDSMAVFKKLYSLTFDQDSNALVTFQRLIDELKQANKKLYVIIDEYDASINTALSRAPDFLSKMQVTEIGRGSFARMENMYAAFFSKIKTACDTNVARCFITGVTPLVISELTSGFNIARHITTDLDFTSLYGFTEADVQEGLEQLSHLKEKPNVRKTILAAWKRDHNGYYFDPLQQTAIYNPTRVLDSLYQLDKIFYRDPKLRDLPEEQLSKDLLWRLRKDSNSMPAETTLQMLKSNRYTAGIVARALSSDTAELDCPGGVVGQFKLSHMNELATDSKPLLSFMFYNGALTYVPQTVDADKTKELKHVLRIPNAVARQEFMAELQKILHLDAIGYNKLRGGISTMLETKRIDSLCSALSDKLLRKLGGRDVRGGEDAFSQAFYDALSLARCPGDRVEKEFKIDSKARAHETPGAALDLVYIREAKELYCFSLKNVKIEWLSLFENEKIWENLVRLDRQTISCMGTAALLGLELGARPAEWYFNLPHGGTVKAVVDQAVSEASTKYLPALQKEFGKENVFFWVVLRVGLRKLIFQPVAVPTKK